MAGNGNGKQLVKLEDHMQLQLIGTYLVQKLQRGTIGELADNARTKLGADIDKRNLKRALTGLRKRGIISVLRDEVGGQSQEVYESKLLNWKQPPEYAHLTDLLPQLMKTKELEAVKHWFDEKEGRGDQKKKRGNDIDEYRRYRATILTRDPLLGSQIKSQYSEYIKELHPSAADELKVEGIWQRDELTGAYVLPPDVLQGWFVTNCLRWFGASEARGTYVAFEPCIIKPNKPVFQYVLPVNSSKTGPSAPKAYEAIPAGQILHIEFLAPTKGLMSSEQYELLFLKAGKYFRRGLSPARGRRFGRYQLLKFEDLGPVKEAGSVDDFFSDIPKELLHEYGSYIADAKKRLSKVSLAPAKGAGAGDDAPFPYGAQETEEAELADEDGDEA